MHHRTLILTAFCSLAAALSAPAQLTPRTPSAPAPQPLPAPKPIKEEDAAKLLAQLESMGKNLDEQKFGHNAKIIKELREAGVTGEKSFALWMDCMKDVEFDQKGKSASEFSDWKRRQTKDPNRDRDGELQMQVQWLSIVLMDANARTDAARGEAVSAAVAFVDNLVARIQKADGHMGGAAAQNVLNSVFAQHYKLDATVNKKEGGALVPEDVDGIYERMIQPFYRETKLAASLMQSWTKRIEQQTAIAGSFKFVEAKEKFTTEKLPELRWGQARDLFKLGQEEPATQTMLSIIKANLAHRRAQNWIEELTSLLKHEDASATTGGRPRGTPTLPPSPTPAPAPEEKPAGPEPDPSKPPPAPGVRPLTPDDAPPPVPGVRPPPAAPPPGSGELPPLPPGVPSLPPGTPRPGAR